MRSGSSSRRISFKSTLPISTSFDLSVFRLNPLTNNIYDSGGAGPAQNEGKIDDMQLFEQNWVKINCILLKKNNLRLFSKKNPLPIDYPSFRAK
jgi:hypothetical protein